MATTPLPRPLTCIIVPMVTPLRDIVGLKDSSANMLYFQRLAAMFRERADFTLLVGPKKLLGQSVLLGGHGGVNGGANLYPRPYVRLYEAARSRNLARVAALQHEVMRISRSLYAVGPSGSSYLRGLKCVLSPLGICNDFLAEPFQPFDHPERRLIEQALHNLGVRNGQGGRACPSHD